MSSGKNRQAAWFASLGIGIAALLALSGCVLNQDAAKAEATTGEGSMLSQEVDNMGTTSGSVATALLKQAVDSLAIDLPVWDAGCGCHIHHRVFTTSGGFTRDRLDSIYFRDSSGASLRYPNPRKLKTIHHIRHITQTKAGREAEITIVTDNALTFGSTDTTGVWEGTISGSFAGETYKSGVISGVTRKKQAGKWQFPESGTITVDRPLCNISVTFTGNNQATVVRTIKATGASVTVTIDSGYKDAI